MLVWLTEFLIMSTSQNHLILRAIMSFLTAFLLLMCFGRWVIKKLAQYKVGQVVRDDGPASHLGKTGTPTMGGVLVLASLILTTLLWADLGNRAIWLVLFVILGYASIGFIDDFRKLVLQNSKGLSGRWKLCCQCVIALLAVSYLYSMASTPIERSLFIPFVKLILPLSGFFIVFAMVVIVGSSNAVNLTDGLDGLAILPVAIVGGALGIFAYVADSHFLSHVLSMPVIDHVGELLIICTAMMGAGLGFLWFNTYPAAVFMGDMGSLALGAGLGMIAVIIHQTLVLFIMGGIFVAEAVSVMLQVWSYKRYGKRIFRMAPLHHHFELKGAKEPQVVVRFWIVTSLLVWCGLCSLFI